MFNKELIDAIREKILLRKETIAVAESVTSGFMQAAISTAKDALQFFQGGITAYNIGQKYRHLLVDPIHALSCNCVSQRVAESMALNRCILFQSQWGIGICGYAAPVPESDHTMYAYYAVAYDGSIVTRGKMKSTQPEGIDTQLFFTETTLQHLYGYLVQNPD
jgi:nicotinamide-nucleotide amidase